MSFLRAKSPEAPRITIADPVIVLKVSILPSLARQARPGQAPPRFRRFGGALSINRLLTPARVYS